MKTWLSWESLFEIVSSPNSSHLIMELRRALAIKAKGRVAIGSKFFHSCWLHFCSKERLPQFLRHSCLLMGFVTPREECHFSSFYVMQMWSTLELSSAISLSNSAWHGSAHPPPNTMSFTNFFHHYNKHLQRGILEFWALLMLKMVVSNSMLKDNRVADKNTFSYH